MHNGIRSRAAADSAHRGGFLARLARNVRGNTLAIVGAAMVPLSAMIGSGVDMSRAYMAKTRLQSACDAAALAGRRVMQGDTFNNAVRDEAVRFFNFNFRQGLYRTDAFTPQVSRPSSGTVRVTASTRIPTTIMNMFGFETLPLNVTCDASLNFVNTDIMLVLDTTGSMAQDINGLPATVPNQKITALRDAVMALYDELRPIQTQLESNGLRLRYGVVPYSTTVNVGALIRDVNPAYLSDSVGYQSRVANYTNAVNVPNTPTTNGPYWEYYRSTSPYYTTNPALMTSISSTNCQKFNRNQDFNPFDVTPTTSGTAPAATVATSFPFDGTLTTGGSGEYGWSGAPDTTTSTRSCRRRRTDTTTTYTVRYNYTNDSFAQVTYDTSQYKLGNPVTVAVDTNSSSSNDDSYAGSTAVSGAYNLIQAAASATGVGTTSTTWNGCIEERDTVDTITSTSGYTIPAGAHDLNINEIPTSNATRWRPQWPRLIWERSSATAGDEHNGGAPCPVAARRLAAWNRGNMQSYVNTLNPTGNTYHDSGMIWGARMISNAGIFADSPDTFASMPVSRHIIFMTDGIMQPDTDVYGMYGVETIDQRITGSSSASGQTSRHTQRFKMICNAAKSMNVSIWVIAFGSALQDHLLECASNANQASVATDRDALIARFREIGSNIGALRLTQ